MITWSTTIDVRSKNSLPFHDKLLVIVIFFENNPPSTANIDASGCGIRGIIGGKTSDKVCPRFLSEVIFFAGSCLGSKPRTASVGGW